MTRVCSIVLVVVLLTSTASTKAAEAPAVEKYLHTGQFTEGEKALRAHLASDPADDQARFGLGVLQFVDAVQHLGNSFYRYGLRSDWASREIPFLRLPVPTNASPEVLTYAATRKVFQDLIDNLQKAETTLAGVHNEQVKLPLHLGPIRLDFAGNGKGDTSLSMLVGRYMGGAPDLKDNPDLLVVFDRGDVAWLRGYCHLLTALAEIVLAHDGQELFDCTAHLFFTKIETPHKFLMEPDEHRDMFFGGVNFADAIAFIHLFRLPVSEPARMKAALTHLEQMISLSKESWKFILAETDDDHEWIPNPHQTGVLGSRVNKQMIDGWFTFIDEMDAILAGKKLIPLWRGKEKRGINLRRVFTEPRTLDLVLWVQGTAATPYLEEGPLTKPELYDQLWRLFNGQFLGFAIWFN
jgi:hypothetical protein